VNDRILQLRIPYTVSFIVKRCHKVATQSFWDAGSVAIRNVSAQQAPIAFIIHDADLLAGMTSSYPIREFDGGFWWPVRHSGGYVGVDQFSERLERTDGDALFTIDPTAELRYHAYPYDSPASFFERVPIRKIQGSTLEARWAAAHRGAMRVMACDGLIHIEAGEPAFFVVDTRAGQLQMVAGPCSLDRTEGYQVAGPSRYDRMVAAVHGLAFGIDERSDEIALLSKRGVSVQIRGDIEVLTGLKPTSAARTLCSEQLADAIWRAGRRERSRLPDALSVLRGFCALDRFDPAQHRTVLEQLVATTDSLVKKVFRQEILDAREILRRLQFGPLTQEEEDALWSL
jgi:hypothetical protein